MNNAHFYGVGDIQNSGEFKSHPWTFIADVYIDNVDLFPNQSNNVNVLEKLKKHDVVPDNCKYSPMPQFVQIHFKNGEQGILFVNNLNQYLQKKHDLITEAENF